MKRSFAIVPAALLTAAAFLSGCGSGDQRLDEVRDNPTPDLSTLYQRPTDVDNAVTVTFNEDGRMFWEDLGRAFYWDRPSRLTREIVPRP